MALMHCLGLATNLFSMFKKEPKPPVTVDTMILDQKVDVEK